jgi:hypothetical protein
MAFGIIQAVDDKPGEKDADDKSDNHHQILF